MDRGMIVKRTNSLVKAEKAERDDMAEEQKKLILDMGALRVEDRELRTKVKTLKQTVSRLTTHLNHVKKKADEKELGANISAAKTSRSLIQLRNALEVPSNYLNKAWLFDADSRHPPVTTGCRYSSASLSR